MRYVVHDYAGHPFQVHLSRRLANRGHEVHHLWNADNPGPKGLMERRPEDAEGLFFHGISLGLKAKAAGTGAQFGVSRVLRDIRYGRVAADTIASIKPDVLLCGNTPADSQRAIIAMCQRLDIPFVYWVQDVYSVAVKTLLRRRLGALGGAIGWYYQELDRRQFQKSDAIVAISEDFVQTIGTLIGRTPIAVIENWAPMDDLPLGAKDNPWSRQQNLHESFAYLYSGTLGRKHNPRFLLKLAERCSGNDLVVAVAQGYGVPLLQEAQRELNLTSLRLLPIQPAQYLADVLATADVLLATIEAEAGRFAVPSKVLSYLCSGRPILLAASRDNLAARTVERANAGIVVDPADESGFLAAARMLRHDSSLRTELGRNGRSYAERTFDLDNVANRFERVLRQFTPEQAPLAMSEAIAAE
jgi:colanic acid biosynthesis glycosyl transferase WcaI